MHYSIRAISSNHRHSIPHSRKCLRGLLYSLVTPVDSASSLPALTAERTCHTLLDNVCAVKKIATVYVYGINTLNPTNGILEVLCQPPLLMSYTHTHTHNACMVTLAKATVLTPDTSCCLCTYMVCIYMLVAVGYHRHTQFF